MDSLCIYAKSLQSCLTLRPCRLQPARLLCPWDSPGKNTGVGCHALLQGIFLTQGSTLCLLHLLPCPPDRRVLYHQGHLICIKAWREICSQFLDKDIPCVINTSSFLFFIKVLLAVMHLDIFKAQESNLSTPHTQPTDSGKSFRI